PNDGFVALHYSSYGTFCVHSKRSIIPTVVLPTTEIIEPFKIKIMKSEGEIDDNHSSSQLG
ncbi:MAG: hypothetical protein ACTH9K_01230, partial [Streptococcus thermophilus]|nr:hypothetical protein [Streptococcus thermophilus]MBZ5825108.1 hypothetical protein [Streptococcus thermophilus]MBZ5847935.1 hypothetical protein [Streptococcus thermophilus]MBZ5849523.1 hypothetical protein [Streptococcus thermophilus]MDA5405852.1 hypothetical protein [Streptococcus thermophilus]